MTKYCANIVTKDPKFICVDDDITAEVSGYDTY